MKRRLDTRFDGLATRPFRRNWRDLCTSRAVEVLCGLHGYWASRYADGGSATVRHRTWQDGTLISSERYSLSDAKALLVTFSTVSAHVSGGDFTTLPFSGGPPLRTCDLKKLTTAQDVLGTGPLATGHYTQLRLVVSSASLYFDTLPLVPPCAATIAAPAGRLARSRSPRRSAPQSRVRRDIQCRHTILLDFDGDQAVKETGTVTL